MNRYNRIKAKRLARFERLGDYLVVLKPDKFGMCCEYMLMLNV